MEALQRPSDGIATLAEEMARSIASMPACADLAGPLGIVVSPKAKFDDWRELMGVLYQACNASGKLLTMVKFMFGDALRQGFDIFGEEASQVIGIEGRWNYRTIENMRWVAERVPPDCRNLQLSFRIHQDLAPLEPAEIRHFMGLAAKYHEENAVDYRPKVLEEINDKKRRDMIAALENRVDRETWTTIADLHKPHWRVMERWIKGRAPVPPLEKAQLDDWVKDRLVLMQSRKNEYAKMRFDDLLSEVIAPALVQLAHGVKRGWIVVDKESERV